MAKKIATPLYIHRDLEKKLSKYLPLPEIIAIVGPRRSGKTTLLKQLMSTAPKANYITFEDQTVQDLFDQEIDSFSKRYLNSTSTLIIDEFQNSRSGGKNLKYLYDTNPGKKIIISGSSSPDLTVKALKYLTGRCLVFELVPLNFTEYLRTKLAGPTTKEIQSHLDEYLTYGGYPEVVLQPDQEIKKTLLSNIYSLFFAREVKDMTSLSDDYKLKNLLRALALSSGSLIEYRELMQVSGFDFLTLKRYLNFLQKTYIAFPIFPYFTNRRTELVKNPKIYFYDLGFRNSLINYFSPLQTRVDKGTIIESFVANTLHNASLEPRYWRTKNKAEVDFVVAAENKLVGYEVKAGIEHNISPSILSFIEKYSPKEIHILNLGSRKSRVISKTRINFTPYWKLNTKGCSSSSESNSRHSD